MNQKQPGNSWFLKSRIMALSQITIRTFSAKIAVALFFILALSASPSIFRGWVNEYWVFAASLVLVPVMLAGGRLHASPRLWASWGIVFPLVALTAMYYSLLVDRVTKPFAAVYILIVLFAVYPFLSDKSFSESILIWWRRLSWVVAILSILTWVLSYAAPGCFTKIHYGELYAGNVRAYFAGPTGMFINQDYGRYALHRVVGILAEPGMMSMVFAVNACLGLLYKNKFFSFSFGLTNLFAGFLTYSVAYYLALTVLAVYIMFTRGRLIRIVAVVAFLFVVILSEKSIVDLISYLLGRSSFHTRERGLMTLLDIIQANPAGVLVGFVWMGIPAQFPSAALQLIYQCGLIGTAAYFYFLTFFTRKMPEITIVFFVYAMTIQYHTYFIIALALVVVGVLQQPGCNVHRRSILGTILSGKHLGAIKGSLLEV